MGIFCVILMAIDNWFEHYFVKYYVIFRCVATMVFHKTFCVIFSLISHTFHIFQILAIVFNNSTHFTILYTLLQYTSLHNLLMRARPGGACAQRGSDPLPGCHGHSRPRVTRDVTVALPPAALRPVTVTVTVSAAAAALAGPPPTGIRRCPAGAGQCQCARKL